MPPTRLCPSPPSNPPHDWRSRRADHAPRGSRFDEAALAYDPRSPICLTTGEAAPAARPGRAGAGKGAGARTRTTARRHRPSTRPRRASGKNAAHTGAQPLLRMPRAIAALQAQLRKRRATEQAAVCARGYDSDDQGDGETGRCETGEGQVDTHPVTLSPVICHCPDTAIPSEVVAALANNSVRRFRPGPASVVGSACERRIGAGGGCRKAWDIADLQLPACSARRNDGDFRH